MEYSAKPDTFEATAKAFIEGVLRIERENIELKATNAGLMKKLDAWLEKHDEKTGGDEEEGEDAKDNA